MPLWQIFINQSCPVAVLTMNTESERLNIYFKRNKKEEGSKLLFDSLPIYVEFRSRSRFVDLSVCLLHWGYREVCMYSN